MKKCQIVMLQVKEKAEDCLIINHYGKLSYNLGYYTESYLNNINAKAFHLYILSNEKIKEGDWCINSVSRIFKWEDNTWVGKELCKKIIATTNRLVVNNSSYEFNEEKSLPQPSPQFLEVFVREYNKGNIITSVMVEYEESFGGHSVKHMAIKDNTYLETLKINPKDNTITIKHVKDSWNRDEVLQLIESFTLFTHDVPLNRHPERENVVNQWIEQNL